jgi:uncharacterized protein (DUF362 family)
LSHFRTQLSNAIGDKRIVLKPNCLAYAPESWVSDIYLADTCVGHLEGVVDFLYSIGKRDITIAESPANGPAFDAYDYLGYFDLKKRYPTLRFADLNVEGYRMVQVYQPNGQPMPVRVSKLLMDRDLFVISSARMKTHNSVVATLSLKNIAMAAPVQDNNLPGGRMDKMLMHARHQVDNHQRIHDNMYTLAKAGVRPDFAIIDGFQGMQGNGPGSGFAMEHRICVASPDWLAADRVCLELMQVEKGLVARGYEAQLPAYLRYCAQAGMGAWSLEDIELVREPIAGNTREYQLHRHLDEQVNLHALPPEQRSAADLGRRAGGEAAANILPGGYRSNEELERHLKSQIA